MQTKSKYAATAGTIRMLDNIDRSINANAGPLLLRDTDVAALLQISPTAVRYLHRVGQLRACKIGKELRWKPSAVLMFVDELQPE